MLAVGGARRRPTVGSVRIPLFNARPTLRAPRAPVRRVLVIVAPMDADVRAVRALGRRLRRRGVAVVAASECHGEVRGAHGGYLLPNRLLVEAARGEWDAVVVAGGAGAAAVAEDQLAREIVRGVAERGAAVAAIGSGRVVLERAGVRGFASDDADEVARLVAEQLGVAATGARERRRGRWFGVGVADGE